jgi:hypothetical protein
MSKSKIEPAMHCESIVFISMYDFNKFIEYNKELKLR